MNYYTGFNGMKEIANSINRLAAAIRIAAEAYAKDVENRTQAGYIVNVQGNTAKDNFKGEWPSGGKA